MSEAALAWRQYRLERRMFWRNPSAAFFSLVLPLLFLALFGAIFADDQETLDVIVPGIAGMSVMSTTFTALAMNLTFLRESGTLKRVRGTPLPPVSYLAGLGLNAVTNALLQVAIIVVAARVLFGIGWPEDWGGLLVFTAIGVWCMAALGVAFSHVIPNFDAAPAFTNIVFLPVIFISGVFFDVDDAPDWMMTLAQVLPLTHLIEGLRGAMVTGEGLSAMGGALCVVCIWAIAGTVLAVRGFSWDAKRA